MAVIIGLAIYILSVAIICRFMYVATGGKEGGDDG